MLQARIMAREPGRNVKVEIRERTVKEWEVYWNRSNDFECFVARKINYCVFQNR